MTQPPTDDERLIDFLQEHAETPPPPAPDLEERIMAAVAASAPAKVKFLPKRSFWLIPSAIAASVLIAWGNGLLTPSKPSATELANLATFLENNWDGVAVDNSATDPESDWIDQRSEE